MFASCPDHVITLGLVMLIIFDEGYKSLSLLCSFCRVLLPISHREEINIHKLKVYICCVFKREWSFGSYDYYTVTGEKRTCSKILGSDFKQQNTVLILFSNLR
jgi:hypothetical protein